MQSTIQPALTADEGQRHWRSLYDELREARLLTPAWSGTVAKLTALFVVFGVTLTLSWLHSSVLVLCAAYVGLALLLAQFAFIGHDAGHRSVSCSPALNRLVGQISMTLVTGLAFEEWIDRHLKHHRYCQHEQQDPDMAVDLFVSLTDKSKQQKGALGRVLTKHQDTHIWLLSLLFGHSQRHLSQHAVIRAPHRHIGDALVLIPHFLLWFGVPCLLLDVSFSKALLAYLVPLTILGPYLAGIFWVNHIGMPLVDQPDRFSFFEHQYATSRTITNPPVLNWLFGGLNFQIEHHLFPQVPSGRLPAVQPIVRRYFEAHRFPYNGTSWWGAVLSIASHLRRVSALP